MAKYDASTDVPEANQKKILRDSNRKNKYATDLGGWEDQMDYIYHHGLDAWKVKVKAVKDAFPKS
jgi:hypothetical protein